MKKCDDCKKKTTCQTANFEAGGEYVLDICNNYEKGDEPAKCDTCMWNNENGIVCGDCNDNSNYEKATTRLKCSDKCIFYNDQRNCLRCIRSNFPQNTDNVDMYNEKATEPMVAPCKDDVHQTGKEMAKKHQQALTNKMLYGADICKPPDKQMVEKVIKDGIYECHICTHGKVQRGTATPDEYKTCDQENCCVVKRSTDKILALFPPQITRERFQYVLVKHLYGTGTWEEQFNKDIYDELYGKDCK